MALPAIPSVSRPFAIHIPAKEFRGAYPQPMSYRFLSKDTQTASSPSIARCSALTLSRLIAVHQTVGDNVGTRDVGIFFEEESRLVVLSARQLVRAGARRYLAREHSHVVV
jgi:hypothetical protein